MNRIRARMRALSCTVLCLAAALLAGCTTDYARADIQAMVRDQLGVRGAVVAQDYTALEGEDGYTDRIWKVLVPQTGLQFSIVDDYHWGYETVTNHLWTDYPEAALAHIADQLPETSLLQVETWQTDGICYGQITGSYTDPDSLRQCRQQLVQLVDMFEELGYEGLSVSYQLAWQGPLRDVTDYVIDDADCTGHTDAVASYDEMLAEYVTTVLDYRIDLPLELTQQQVDTALAGYRYRLGVYRGAQTDPEDYEPQLIDWYDDLIANKYAYGISFGTLYEVLLREGLAPEGDAWHYTFTGADGSRYEVSYDFIAPLFTDEEGAVRQGYYYQKDGETVPMGYYFYNHFTAREVLELTGLRLVDHTAS